MSKIVIGIDLGTTNSAVAFVRRPAEESSSTEIELYEIPQLVAPGEGAPCKTLPSFLYIAGEYDLSSESLWLPWNPKQRYAVGTLAREQGALVPTRLVSSAKSWLCYPEVDRRAKILPWGSDLGEEACSPVEASARYLSHIRDAWNYEVASGESNLPPVNFEQQDIVLTVPASFDEEARELTVEAARTAGFQNLTLLEEPLAAFYAWIAAHNRQFDRYLKDGDIVLVCDVGGGTTDFSLIRVTKHQDEVSFERIAVGKHILLGGDNVDHALAQAVESKLSTRLSIEQRASLLRQCCAAKEQLLDENGAESKVIRLAGSGSRFVGAFLQAELSKKELLELLLEGFLPKIDISDLPSRHRTALRQIGLPYESDPAITRHLAAFLTSASQNSTPVRPDAVLFNGGFFKPEILRKRVCQVLASWFDYGSAQQPKLLSNHSLDTAVAIGAAYYGTVRRSGGLRVGAGSPRAYYIAVAQEDEQPSAVCILPRGTQEGTHLTLDNRLFELQTNRAVVFSLWSSTTRRGDKLGDIVLVGEDMHLHSPLDTILRYGRRTSSACIPVKLEIEFTEVGTLELWCRSQISDHRWRLRFQIRKSSPSRQKIRRTSLVAAPTTATVIDESAAQAALELITQTFASDPKVSPVELPSQLEEVLRHSKDAWPMELVRQMADRLLELNEGRRHSPQHEARWLNLTGFCLRPGFGHPMDELRLVTARHVYHAGLVFTNDEQAQAEWMVFCRRICGGFTRGQQIEFHNRYAPLLLGKKRHRLNPQVERELWRTLASLEAIQARQKAELGNVLLERLLKRPSEAFLWAIGRLGARIPFTSTIDTVVAASVVSRWIEKLLTLETAHVNALATALANIAAYTADPAREIDEKLRKQVEDRLSALGKSDLVKRLWEYVPAERAETEVFGESLPVGLKLIY
ncbi:MAG: Hsp70 family protein [Acidobacteriota bacterium]|nr:hsp70 family protein [Blastocatellia bacterium]MDW8412679.1 Hsp70 family protein [Acidobacteriota bacterium]